MILTLIAIGALIIGIVCLVVCDRMHCCPDWVAFIGIPLTAVGLLCSMLSIGAIITTNVNKDIDYQNMLYKREMLEHRINNMNENIVGNEMIYVNIVDFNNELRAVKKWANNPWTNWFNNQDIAAMDYIELNDN